MNVGELIAALSQVDPSLPVILDDGEGTLGDADATAAYLLNAQVFGGNYYPRAIDERKRPTDQDVILLSAFGQDGPPLSAEIADTHGTR